MGFIIIQFPKSSCSCTSLQAAFSMKSAFCKVFKYIWFISHTPKKVKFSLQTFFENPKKNCQNLRDLLFAYNSLESMQFVSYSIYQVYHIKRNNYNQSNNQNTCIIIAWTNKNWKQHSSGPQSKTFLGQKCNSFLVLTFSIK